MAKKANATVRALQDGLPVDDDDFVVGDGVLGVKSAVGAASL